MTSASYYIRPRRIYWMLWIASILLLEKLLEQGLTHPQTWKTANFTKWENVKNRKHVFFSKSSANSYEVIELKKKDQYIFYLLNPFLNTYSALGTYIFRQSKVYSTIKKLERSYFNALLLEIKDIQNSLSASWYSLFLARVTSVKNNIKIVALEAKKNQYTRVKLTSKLFIRVFYKPFL